jgi:hypothetical protein
MTSETDGKVIQPFCIIAATDTSSENNQRTAHAKKELTYNAAILAHCNTLLPNPNILKQLKSLKTIVMSKTVTQI